MLRIHILNVGHGDSIVLEYTDAGRSTSFAVIDSNCKANAEPPALALLKSLGATSLSFVAITHPHADHYMGMRAILEHFSERIDTLYTFPIRQDAVFIKQIITAYKKFATGTDNKDLHRKLIELAHVLRLAPKVARYWEAPSGTITGLPAVGFTGVRISTILPPANVKGNFFQRVMAGSIEPEVEDLNDLSLAILIEYAGQQIILGGDGTFRNWHYQAKRWATSNIHISPVAVKLPHHGAKRDCQRSVLTALFGHEHTQNPESIACISANGKSHPDHDVLLNLVARGIKPYCTNLSSRCGNARRARVGGNETDPVLLRLINAAALDDEAMQPCQGNITLELCPGAPLSVTTQMKNLCALRGDFAFLGGALQ